MKKPPNFRVQYLDRSATVIAELHAHAHSTRGAIELVEGLEWPLADAVRMRILGAGGREVHERRKGETR